jgi:hypothetical protein
MRDLETLRGHRIKNVFVERDGTYIMFETDTKQKFVYSAYGDCCSRTWVERVAGLDALRGEVVTAVEERELPHPTPIPDCYESLAVYCNVLKTLKGECEIEYRNDSNGYYGGSLELDSYPAHEVRKWYRIRGDEWVCNDAQLSEW